MFWKCPRKLVSDQNVTVDAYTSEFDKPSETSFAQSSEKHLSLKNCFWFGFSKLTQKVAVRAPAKHIFHNICKSGVFAFV